MTGSSHTAGSRSGKLKLAFSAVLREDGLLRRYDVCAARFKGLSLEGEPEEAQPAEEAAIQS